jgi:hypothetical protein
LSWHSFGIQSSFLRFFLYPLGSFFASSLYPLGTPFSYPGYNGFLSEVTSRSSLALKSGADLGQPSIIIVGRKVCSSHFSSLGALVLSVQGSERQEMNQLLQPLFDQRGWLSLRDWTVVGRCSFSFSLPSQHGVIQCSRVFSPSDLASLDFSPTLSFGQL